jgi:hypothetical protein
MDELQARGVFGRVSILSMRRILAGTADVVVLLTLSVADAIPTPVAATFLSRI